MTDWNLYKGDYDEIEVDNEEEDYMFLDCNDNYEPIDIKENLAHKPNSYTCYGEYMNSLYDSNEEDFEEEDNDSQYNEHTNDKREEFQSDFHYPLHPPQQIVLKSKPIKVKSKNKRNDRCIYKHKNGSGYRKPKNKIREIDEEKVMYLDDGFDSYSDRIHELRISTFNDLRPTDDFANEESSNHDFRCGCGSKIINIIKVRPGSFTPTRKAILQDQTNTKEKLTKLKLNKKDIISKEIDMNAHDYWDHVSHELMQDGAFVEAKYLQFKEKALFEREKYGPGNSIEMNMLYCFWCFYLREHFNREMYQEFLKLAREDNEKNNHYGIECFFRFCSYGLEMFWNKSVYDDFEEEAMREYKKGDKYGLEKFKAFHINQKYDFPIPIKPETRAELDKYPTCRSFREPLNTKQVPSIQVIDFVPTDRRTKRSISDLPVVKFSFGAMTQPKLNNNKNRNRRNKRKNNDKQERGQHASNSPPKPATQDVSDSSRKNIYKPPKEMTEREKEMNEKMKQQKKEKESQPSKLDVQSLPAKKAYQPPKLTSDQMKNFNEPPSHKYTPKYGASKPKTDHIIQIGVAKQPQSLPKNSSFRRNKW